MSKVEKCRHPMLEIPEENCYQESLESEIRRKGHQAY
jgi:hypothetical protein